MLPTLLLAATVALTFDDIPGVAIPGAPCKSAELLKWNRQLLDTLRKHRAPALGLVVASRTCDDGVASILNAWVDDGHDLGNHSWSHLDLNVASIERYTADIARGEPPIQAALARHDRKLRYFRYPMLRTGDTALKKAAVESFLEKRGYINAPVTFDNQEWVFAEAYARAVAKKDSARAKRIAAAYLVHMEETVAFMEKRTKDVFGRDIPHVLLLHMNGLNAVALDDVLVMLKRRGYRFVTMDEALRDPAYKSRDTYVGRRGLSWIHRWGLAKGMPVAMEPREPDWLRQ